MKKQGAERLTPDLPPDPDLSGWTRAALRRPPSWADPAALPSPGCFCSCCQGQRWWTEAEMPKGWRCWTCHPPTGAAPGGVREVTS